MMDISRILRDLSAERPIFSSEADFQHALAWQLHLAEPSTKIRLEYRPQATRIYLDIVVESENKRTAIELKYKTRRLEATVNGESYWLANHGAQDCGKYDVLCDIERLEHVVDGEQFHEGYMIFLTNDPHYFASRGEGKQTIDEQFRLTQGRILTGELKWSTEAGAGTTRGREEPIRLSGQYQVNWMPYSGIETPYGEFQYMLVNVSPVERVERVKNVVPLPAIPSESKGNHAPVRSSLGSNGAAGMLSDLASFRPVFRSQFDFRDALAALLQSQGWRVTTNREMGGGLKTDIWAEKQGEHNIAIEIRYKTSLLTCNVQGETFTLKNQAAHDISRYDYWRDVEKLEQIVASRPGTNGYAILITNEHLYWDKPTKHRSVDTAFLLHEGRIASGTLAWSEHAGKGTMDNREEPIHLEGTYSIAWQDYSEPSHEKKGRFRVLVLRVGGK